VGEPQGRRGAPPVWTRKGWLVLYHGVSGREQHHRVRYCAGVLLLDRHDLRRVLYRSSQSVLEPRLAAEREGMVPQVVFPTGVDVQPDGALDVYYGIADSRIGVARTRCGMVPAPAPARAA
jgi:beta-1,2-mannobiose phosphorylase / 1,2-beta-oligomannan phosphorylase